MNIFNHKGFSLVETMVAAGLAGGLALTVAKLGQESNKVSKTSETNTEIANIMSDITYILSDKTSCNETLGVNSSIGSNISAIKRVINTNINEVYKTAPQKYSNGLISFKSITTESSPGGVNLVLTITRENLAINGAREITKRIPLKATVNAGKIQSCYSDTESMIETAVQMACKGNSARWDPVTKECHHQVQALICDAGKVVQQVVTDDGTIKAECVPIITNPANCPSGHFLKSVSATGTLACAPMETPSCLAGQYAVKITNGQLECRTIPRCNGNQSFLRSNPATGELICVTLACNPTNQYFAGLDNTGAAICKTFPDKTCGQGQYIKEVRNDGTVICGDVPNHLSLPKSDYSFVDGFDSATNTWSRKDVNQIAEQVCNKITGFSWNGTNCVPPAGGNGGPWVRYDNRLEYAPENSDFKMIMWDYGQTEWKWKNQTVVSLVLNGTSLGAHGPGAILDLRRSPENTTTPSSRNISISHGRIYMNNGEISASGSGTTPEMDFGFNHVIHPLNGLKFSGTHGHSITKNARCDSFEYNKMRIAVMNNNSNEYRLFICLKVGGNWSWKEMRWFD